MESEILEVVVSNSFAICPNAGRYRSIENGVTVINKPNIRIITVLLVLALFITQFFVARR